MDIVLGGFKRICKVLYYLQLILFSCIMLFLLYLALDPDGFVSKLAEYIVIPANPKVADVIIVTSGDENSKRIQEGIRLYQEGYSDYIIFSGYRDYSDGIVNRMMNKAGIDRKSYAIDGKAESTYENAWFQRDYVEQEHIQSMLVVFSPPQSRRGKIVFDYVYPKLDVFVSYSAESVYDPKAVFDNKEIREQFSREAVKYGYYLLKYGLWFR